MRQSKLAIIIPAFKREFLEDALHSIVNQTNKHFSVYIGDDESPHDLKEIVDRFEGKLNCRYHRFENNLGKKSLTRHWERCIGLSDDEEWIWLFSDDDVLSPNCVNEFYRELDRTRGLYDLYRFELEHIDKNGKLLSLPGSYPKTFSSLEFLYQKYVNNCCSSAPEYIFSRKVYEQEKGFQDFPLAWFSDDATWFKFAATTGVYSIHDATVNVRLSGDSITTSPHYSAEKCRATLLFAKWLEDTVPKRIDLQSSRNELLWKKICERIPHTLAINIAHHYLVSPHSGREGLIEQVRKELPSWSKQIIENLPTPADESISLHKKKGIISRFFYKLHELTQLD